MRILEIEGVSKRFEQPLDVAGRIARALGADLSDEVVQAVDNVSFSVEGGEVVGLVGESGCGKSTTSTMVMRLIDKTDGVITFSGEDIGAIRAKEFATLPQRKRIQMVFQDPTDSLNPRYTAARAIADPILRLGDIAFRDAAAPMAVFERTGEDERIVCAFNLGDGPAPADLAWTEGETLLAGGGTGPFAFRIAKL